MSHHMSADFVAGIRTCSALSLTPSTTTANETVTNLLNVHWSASSTRIYRECTFDFSFCDAKTAGQCLTDLCFKFGAPSNWSITPVLFVYGWNYNSSIAEWRCCWARIWSGSGRIRCPSSSSLSTATSPQLSPSSIGYLIFRLYIDGKCFLDEEIVSIDCESCM